MTHSNSRTSAKNWKRKDKTKKKKQKSCWDFQRLTKLRETSLLFACHKRSKWRKKTITTTENALDIAWLIHEVIRLYGSTIIFVLFTLAIGIYSIVWFIFKYVVNITWFFLRCFFSLLLHALSIGTLDRRRRHVIAIVRRFHFFSLTALRYVIECALAFVVHARPSSRSTVVFIHIIGRQVHWRMFLT